MGTNSNKKFLKNVSGQLTEEAAVSTSAGAGDADKIPALNAGGVLDPSIVNAKVVSTGASDAGKVAQLDGGGRLDISVMPTGMGADTATITASEALADGDLVNIYNNGGTPAVRKADASAAGKEAMGFVKANVSANGAATVYFEGTNDHVTGQTGGRAYLSATTPGKATNTPPTGSGQVVQCVGFVTAATALNFQYNAPITLA